jgi:hypothetical protein
MILILDPEHNVEHFFEQEDDIYTLRYSNGRQWEERIRGKIAMQIEETGNGYKITGFKKDLDYAQMEYLQILLSFMKQPDFKTVEI